MEEWIGEIEKRTGGKVKIKYYPGGTLTPAAQVYDGVVKGISDIGESCFAYTRGKFPVMEAIDLPFGYKSAVEATNLANAVYKKFQPKELADVKVLILHAHGPGILHTKFPVSKLEDVKGRKIRATGLASKIVTALGGAPVGTTMPETYDALRTGVAEGALAPAEALQGWKWGEVVSYTIQSFGSAYTTAMFVVMNKSKWNSLPKDVQKVFEEVSAEFTKKQAELWDQIDKEGYEFLKSKGNKIVPLSPEENARWAKAVSPLLDDYVKEVSGKGIPGSEIVKFCLDFLKTQK
jgi:TRAP-type C4-dicarboxylate transport system substrate-binding protein